MMTDTIYTHRFLARIVIEAQTPLAVGSGEKNIFTDACVALDVNGLPYIPGTSIAGVLRHAIGTVANEFFGYHDNKEGEGSKIIFSEARIVGEGGIVIDGLIPAESLQSEFYRRYQNLPIRQHVRINHKGAAAKTGKFDEQVVYKGTRFCFEMEMLSDGNNFNQFEAVLQVLRQDTLRMGGGSHSGFGELKIISIVTRSLNLANEEELASYLTKSSCLAAIWDGDSPEVAPKPSASGWIRYQLNLTPEDFFLFGSGFGDDDADMTPVKEAVVMWNGNTPSFVDGDRTVLIPASSIKGALAHRTAFYYNKKNKKYANDENNVVEIENFIGKHNEAVKALFGSDGEMKDGKMQDQQPGRALFSDIIEVRETSTPNKLLNHVAIDRFTGGAMDGALFTEKTTAVEQNASFTTTIWVSKKAFEKADVRDAFEAALNDLIEGRLPLGGGVNRGNGIFNGTMTIKEGE